MTKLSEEEIGDLDAQHECFEGIIGQNHFVSIWGHSSSAIEKKVFSVNVYKLPEDFCSITDIGMFRTETPYLNNSGQQVGTNVSYDFGELQRTEWFDNFDEAMSVVFVVLAQNTDRIRNHA